jgi:hypothetical protein
MSMMVSVITEMITKSFYDHNIILCPDFVFNQHTLLYCDYRLYFSSFIALPSCLLRAVEYALSSTGIEVLSYHGDLNSKERSVLSF